MPPEGLEVGEAGGSRCSSAVEVACGLQPQAHASAPPWPTPEQAGWLEGEEEAVGEGAC